MSSEEVKTSEEWYGESSGYIILDYDAWDRTNLHYSFSEEKVTREEYLHRLLSSTVVDTTQDSKLT